ncbi:MAG: hypothetical protein JO252_04735 [Planctomycetaceae bacterium]|nr:hypothetical protein [Planctomycetaceae bacterium]MBV8317424.1 hypothetical protein [Planctomycetaceae bacterium]MBV8606372.1 hypothetical protein [Singulisphaera sp.]
MMSDANQQYVIEKFINVAEVSGWNRFFGGLKLAGGALQAVGGMAFATITSGTVVGAVAGGAVALKGVDDAIAGGRSLFSGRTMDTLTYQGVESITGSRYAAFVADIGLDVLALPVSAAGLSVAGRSIGTTTVYTSVNGNGAVKYVGITDNFGARAIAHHLRKGIGIKPVPGLTKLARTDARAVEQVLIETYGLGRDGGSLLNKINSIASDNRIYKVARASGARLTSPVRSLLRRWLPGAVEGLATAAEPVRKLVAVWPSAELKILSGQDRQSGESGRI